MESRNFVFSPTMGVKLLASTFFERFGPGGFCLTSNKTKKVLIQLLMTWFQI